MPKFLTLALTLIIAGCAQFPGVYKIPVEQGNQLTESKLSQVEPGMSREQVRFLIGTPIFVNRLQNDRWIYVTQQMIGDEVTESSKVELRFNGNELVEIQRVQ